MTANTPVRAATAGDLVDFRTDNQGVKFGLAIHKPAVVYSARVNQTTTDYDNMVFIEYYGGSGTLANVLPGMSLYIGSAAGKYDKGIVRIRKTPTDAQFFIGARSDLQFSLHDYLTVVNEFRLWNKETDQSGGLIRMDSDIEYANRGGSAIVRAGPMVAVLHLVAGVATFTPPSPALSACYDGATIASWLYAAPGSASTSNMTAGDGTASWTYNAAGQYRWSLTVTDSNGRTTTTYRWVFVDPTSPDFELSQSPAGDVETGGWSFGVTMYDNALPADIVDRAMVTLYTEAEYFGGINTVIGKLTGFENIVCTGWIDGESISRDSQQGLVTFTVYGAAYWMEKTIASALELEYTGTTPTAWSQIEGMTVDKALAHILSWMSTAPMIMDCFFSGDTTILQLLTQPSGSLKSQLESIALNTIFAMPIVNSLGQLYIQIDPQMMNSTAKSALTTVMTITSADFQNPLDFERLNNGKDAMVELQCNTYDGNAVTPVYSRAPGNISKQFGGISAPTNYISADQDECNRLAGCLLALGNMNYESVEITLVMQNRLIDIAPAQYCQLSIAAGDTPRGIVLTNQKIIPRRISYNFQEGYYSTVVTFELATNPIDGVAYFPPIPVETTVPDYDFDDSGIGSFPDISTDFPDVLPVLPAQTVPNCKTSTDLVNAPANQTALTFDKLVLRGSDGDRVAYAYCPCYVRKGAAQAPTDIWLIGNFMNSKSSVHLYGVKGGSRVVTATMNLGTMGGKCTFAPANAVQVDGFELEIDAGDGYVAGDILESGSVNGNHGLPPTVIATVEVGKFYSIENSGGPWRKNGTVAAYSFVPDLALAGGGKGIFGTGGWLGTGGGFGDTISLQVDELGFYTRVFFAGLAGDLYFGVADNEFIGNTGSLGYILREATAGDLFAAIGSSTLRNICLI